MGGARGAESECLPITPATPTPEAFPLPEHQDLPWMGVSWSRWGSHLGIFLGLVPIFSSLLTVSLQQDQ